MRRIPRVSLRTFFVVSMSAVVLFQLAAVTLEALPPNRYSQATQGSRTYLSPYFAQNWRLFAPNPIAEDRSLVFQGAYRDAAGELRETEWVDWTAVELDVVRHRLVGSRAGYISNKFYTPLARTYRSLTRAQRSAAESWTAAEAPSIPQVRAALSEASGEDGAVIAYLRYDAAATRLAANVLSARYAQRKLVAVRYALRSQPVIPYARRSLPKKQREASRPPLAERLGGWRQPIAGRADEAAVVADFDRRHR